MSQSAKEEQLSDRGPSTYWPHAPMYVLSEPGAYLITAGTYRKLHHFAGAERLHFLTDSILALFREFDWQIEAWAVFSNHYHVVAQSPQHADTLRDLIGLIHQRTAKLADRLDGAPQRKVWHNFWESHITYQRSYLARLQYVHENAVKHRLVLTASAYPWCSAGWFESSAQPAQIRTLRSLKIDRVNFLDDFEASPDW
jgi:putative transposase